MPQDISDFGSRREATLNHQFITRIHPAVNDAESKRRMEAAPFSRVRARSGSDSCRPKIGLFIWSDPDEHLSHESVRVTLDRLPRPHRVLRRHLAPFCEKCGEEDIHTRFIPSGHHVSWEDLRYSCRGKDNLPVEIRVECSRYIAVKDVLYRRCRTCGWWWTERPLSEKTRNR